MNTYKFCGVDKFCLDESDD